MAPTPVQPAADSYYAAGSNYAASYADWQTAADPYVGGGSYATPSYQPATLAYHQPATPGDYQLPPPSAPAAAVTSDHSSKTTS